MSTGEIRKAETARRLVPPQNVFVTIDTKSIIFLNQQIEIYNVKLPNALANIFIMCQFMVLKISVVYANTHIEITKMLARHAENVSVTNSIQRGVAAVN